jgi:hypothetical protein
MDAVMTMSGRMYSVDVELENGARTVVQVEAESSSDAYRQARETANVRRVGRVTEGVRNTHSAATETPRREEERRPGEDRARTQRAPERQMSPAHRGQLLGNMIAGPRVVREARVVGGERPFAHLQPPPPRPEPIRPPVKPAKAKTTVAAAPQPKAVAVVAPAVPGTDYRVVKSRRKDGQPYLLQRGTWSTQGTKRTYAAEWEKGFDTREQAEKHQAWLLEMASDHAEVLQLAHVQG